MSEQNSKTELIRKYLLSRSRGASARKIAENALGLKAPEKIAESLVAGIIGQDDRFEFKYKTWNLREDRFTPALSSRFVVVDIETTGGRPSANRIIELSAFSVEKGVISSSFTSLINPGRKIPGFISHMTGIYDVHVKDAPQAEEVLPSFMRFLGGDAFVAHNARFDWSFINMELSRYGMPIMDNDMLCTVRLTRRIFPGERSYGLDNLINKFGLELNPTDRHRGLGDAWAAAEILLRCMEKLDAANISSIEQMLRFQVLPVAEARNFIS